MTCQSVQKCFGDDVVMTSLIRQECKKTRAFGYDLVEEISPRVPP